MVKQMVLSQLTWPSIPSLNDSTFK